MAHEVRVNFAAIARVARRVELREIRLVDLSAKLVGEEGESLTATTDHEVEHEMDAGTLTVKSIYTFGVTAGDRPVAEIKATYRLLYDDRGTEPISELDLSQFAAANGMYHSWPFLRQLVFDFTAKMGFPPYTLPVVLFNPEPKQEPRDTAAVEQVSPKATEEDRAQT